MMCLSGSSAIDNFFLRRDNDLQNTAFDSILYNDPVSKKWQPSHTDSLGSDLLLTDDEVNTWNRTFGGSGVLDGRNNSNLQSLYSLDQYIKEEPQQVEQQWQHNSFPLPTHQEDFQLECQSPSLIKLEKLGDGNCQELGQHSSQQELSPNGQENSIKTVVPGTYMYAGQQTHRIQQQTPSPDSMKPKGPQYYQMDSVSTAGSPTFNTPQQFQDKLQPQDSHLPDLNIATSTSSSQSQSISPQQLLQTQSASPVSCHGHCICFSRNSDKNISSGQLGLNLRLCSHCGHSYNYTCGLSAHLKFKGRSLFPCDDCGRCFVDKDLLNDHIVNQHQGQGISNKTVAAHVRFQGSGLHSCEECGKCFTKADYKDEHIRTVHRRLLHHPFQPIRNEGFPYHHPYKGPHQSTPPPPPPVAHTQRESPIMNPVQQQQVTSQPYGIQREYHNLSYNMPPKAHQQPYYNIPSGQQSSTIITNKVAKSLQYSCSKCLKEFESKTKLHVHIIREHQLPMFQLCTDCLANASPKVQKVLKCMPPNGTQQNCKACGRKV